MLRFDVPEAVFPVPVPEKFGLPARLANTEPLGCQDPGCGVGLD